MHDTQVTIDQMAHNYRILVVEDDETLCDTLQFNLELEGYHADKAYSAEEAMNMNPGSYDLILLDVMMGAMSGFHFARLLKKSPATANVPIIFCTARDSEDDMVAGLNLGADDYIFKPFTIRNVLARVKTVLRRTAGALPGANTLVRDGIELNLDLKRCRVDGRDAGLVRKEFEILYFLLSNPDRVFSRQEILDHVWKGEVIVSDRTVDVNITRIRHKIAPYGDRLITRAGYGYGFV